MAHSESSRFQVVEKPPAMPGACGICGSADKEYFVDLKLDFEFYGVLYFCDECIADIARTVNFATPDDTAALKEKIGEVVTENLILKQKLRAAEAYIRESFSVDFSSDSAPDPLTDSINADVESAKVAEEGVGEEGSDDSATTESAVIERPDDVRNSAKSKSAPDLTL